VEKNSAEESKKNRERVKCPSRAGSVPKMGSALREVYYADIEENAWKTAFGKP